LTKVAFAVETLVEGIEETTVEDLIEGFEEFELMAEDDCVWGVEVLRDVHYDRSLL
jgi:hypothetical protein